ncbi:NADH-quinone oxidoreductase subunit N [Opitutales bacterium ASA1]|uniref:NADH-quinone oxidoreductase subunit N n=1 Tax=Congregicoccus parvus TaxID=3081749 RepID=UPI002B315377|nr:NADH-quinone oxidoreductase subunit N [Opitutales bacterium ASA1]
MPSVDLSVLKEAAAANTWASIYPELSLGLLALALLVLEIMLPRARHGLIPRIAFVGQLAILGWVASKGLGLAQPTTVTFGGLLMHSGAGQAFRIFFLATGALVTWLGMISLERQKLPRVEFFHIVLVVTGAMMLLVQSNNFVMLFVALETVTVGFYVLVSYFKSSTSLEAGLKYLVLGALSSAMLTFGIVLLYGVAGNPALPGSTANALDFVQLRLFLEANPDNILAIVGVLLVLCGVAFKVGAFPFQIWIPDVYQGAPTPVTAFLAVGSKAAGVGVLLKLVTLVFVPLSDLLVPILSAVAAATILFGNFAALTQRNTKRLLGLSGVSHAGYLMLGVIAALTVNWAVGAILFYLFAYMIASIAVFGVLAHLSDTDDVGLETDDFVDLGKKHPLLGFVLAAGIGSLAGIPPLAGFIGKALIFVAIFKAGFYGLLAVAIVGVVLSIYYYFGWMKLALFEFTRVVPPDVTTKELEVRPVPAGSRFVLGALALAALVLGLFQGPLSGWMSFN